MTNIVPIEIERLQPTKTVVSKEKLDELKSTYPLLRDNTPPEIWDINGEFLIVEGHNQLYDRLNINKITTMFVKLVSLQNLGDSFPAYSFIADDLLRKRDEARKQNVYSIKDMVM
jgi:hypothetical protein